MLRQHSHIHRHTHTHTHGHRHRRQMATFKVHHRSPAASLVAAAFVGVHRHQQPQPQPPKPVQRRQFLRIPAIASLHPLLLHLLLASALLQIADPLLPAAEASALPRHHSAASGDMLMSTLADAHNLIGTGPGRLSVGGEEDGGAGSTGGADASLKVCAFKLHRLADVAFTDKVTVLMMLPPQVQVRRQAFLFNRLEMRFRIAGFAQVQFVIVVQPEVEVGGALADGDTVTSGGTVFEDRFERMESVFNVTVLRQRQAAREPQQQFVSSAVYVFDECGHFTYIIYAPWSSIQRPYVKAAILSTFYDNPCDRCERKNASPYPVRFPVVSTQSMSLSDIRLSVAELVTTDTSTSSSSSSSISPTTTERSASSSDETPATTTAIDDSDTKISAEAAFVMPIRVIAPIVHAHREMLNTSSTSTAIHNETNAANATEYYLKFNYIEMHSNDLTYHGHLTSDVPERLALITREELAIANDSEDENIVQPNLAATADSILVDQLAAESSVQPRETPPRPTTVEMHFVTDYGKRYVSSLAVEQQDRAGVPVEEDAPPRRPPLNSRYSDEFVNLEETPRHTKQRSNTGRMVAVRKQPTDSQPPPNESNGQEERAINEHYGRILPWIQVSL